ncbi:LuxR C-terminal-related transcriptional regulator [Luethyella okanaganae]|uniref:LuxR C-terminal-related transcriptional regulator n=1 Tax=Luethyella okanaganae TaxID=69372 RepID=A0ABW1VD13_9MICO
MHRISVLVADHQLFLHNDREIGLRLVIAEGTVKRHTTNMYLKLGATSWIDTIRKARHHMGH